MIDVLHSDLHRFSTESINLFLDNIYEVIFGRALQTATPSLGLILAGHPAAKRKSLLDQSDLEFLVM